MGRKRLGELLLEAGLIDETGLRAALVEQRRFGGPLGRVLVDMRLISEDDMVGALSKQLATPTVDLDGVEVPPEVLELVSADFAESHGVVPFAQPMRFLDVATSDPTNQAVIDELRVKTKLNVRTFLAGPRAIERALARYYRRNVSIPRGSATMPPPAGTPARRARETVDLDVPAPTGRMDVISGFELDAETARARSGSRPPGFSNPAMTPPSASAFEPQRVTPTTPPPAAPVGPAPSMAAIAALQERIAGLEALLRRDEDVIKKLMALLIEKGVFTRDELIQRLK